MGWLDGEEAGGLEHSELELRIETHGRELLRALFQDHLDLRAERELRAERVADVRCVERRAVRPIISARSRACSVRCRSSGWPTGLVESRTCIRPMGC